MDLIERSAAINVTWEEPSYSDPLNTLTEVRDKLKALPSAQPEYKIGHWIEDWSDLGYMCSECSKKLDDYVHATESMTLSEIPNYCPNCGARMEEQYESD